MLFRSAGILDRIYTVVAVVCGEFVYFLLKSVNQNAALFSAKETITKKSVVTLAVLQIFTDKEMYFYLAAFAAAAVIVSCVRRLSVDHARTIAIVLGIAVQLGVICSAPWAAKAPAFPAWQEAHRSLCGYRSRSEIHLLSVLCEPTDAR